MAKMSFKAPSPAPSTPVTAVAVAEPPPVPAPVAALTEYGEIDRSDIQIPRISLVQKTGDLSELHPSGSFVLSNEYAISNGSDPLNIVVVHMKKTFVEALDFGSEEISRTFNTSDEVRAAGLTLDWVGDEKPSAKPVLNCMVAIEAPSEDPVLFPYQFNGKAYALATWKISGTAYTSAAKPILTAATLALGGVISAGQWQLTSKSQKGGKGTFYVPVVRQHGRTPEPLRQFLLGLASR
jgi:hypothetical protein